MRTMIFMKPPHQQSTGRDRPEINEGSPRLPRPTRTANTGSSLWAARALATGTALTQMRSCGSKPLPASWSLAGKAQVQTLRLSDRLHCPLPAPPRRPPCIGCAGTSPSQGLCNRALCLESSSARLQHGSPWPCRSWLAGHLHHEAFPPQPIGSAAALRHAFPLWH